MTIVVKKVPKAFRGIVKFLFRIKEWFFRIGDGSFHEKNRPQYEKFSKTVDETCKKWYKYKVKF